MADAFTGMPDTAAADARQHRDAALQATIDALAAPNPHPDEMALPVALTDDGGC